MWFRGMQRLGHRSSLIETEQAISHRGVRSPGLDRPRGRQSNTDWRWPCETFGGPWKRSCLGANAFQA